MEALPAKGVHALGGFAMAGEGRKLGGGGVYPSLGMGILVIIH